MTRRVLGMRFLKGLASSSFSRFIGVFMPVSMSINTSAPWPVQSKLKSRSTMFELEFLFIQFHKGRIRSHIQHKFQNLHLKLKLKKTMLRKILWAFWSRASKKLVCWRYAALCLQFLWKIFAARTSTRDLFLSAWKLVFCIWGRISGRFYGNWPTAYISWKLPASFWRFFLLVLHTIFT